MREPGSDDVPLLDRLPEWTPPDSPLCPIPPRAFLRWWSRVTGAPVLSVGEYAITWGLNPAEARDVLLGRSRYLRRLQWRRRRASLVIAAGAHDDADGRAALARALALRQEPDSAWPQLAGGRHEVKLPTVEEWTAELDGRSA